MFNFENKTVLITGAGKGLGQTVSLAFAKAGAKVCVSARTLNKLKQTTLKLQSINADFLPLKLDVLSYTDCEQAVNSAIKKFGRLDCLINIASAGTGKIDLRQIKPKEIERDINTTYRGAVYMTKAALNHFIKRKTGTIVNVSSVGGLNNFSSRASGIYGGSKAAVIRFSERMHEILSEKGVRVCCLVPCSMKAENAEKPSAVSYQDAAKAIMFQCLDGGNLSLQTIILKPKNKRPL